MKSLVVGFCGGSGSGKSFLANELIRKIGVSYICHLSQDHYYLPRHLQPLDENGISNFDTPQSLDLKQYARDVASLKSGHQLIKEEYTYNNPNRNPRKLTFEPAPVLITDGLFLLYPVEIRNLLDFIVYIDAPEHLMLERRIKRDAQERGYDSQDAIYRFENHVKPLMNQYLIPFKDQAQFIINNDGHEQDATLDNLILEIRKRVL